GYDRSRLGGALQPGGGNGHVGQPRRRPRRSADHGTGTGPQKRHPVWRYRLRRASAGLGGWRMDTGGNGDAGHSDRRSDVGTWTGTLRSDLWPGGLEPEPEVGATASEDGDEGVALVPVLMPARCVALRPVLW